MIARLAKTLTAWSERWVPDPFAIAIVLTGVTFALVWAIEGVSPLDALGLWGGRLQGDEVLGGERGLWKLLTFAMQVCLTLVTGHALASAPAVRRAIDAATARVGSPAGAVVMTAVTAMAAGYLNWALGLIVGALTAREVGRSCSRRRIAVHYPLLGAAGYTGLLVWHGGLSASAPLKVTRASEIADIMPGVTLAPVPLTDTLGSGLNLAVTALCLVVVPALLVVMRPRDEIRGFEQFEVPADPVPPPIDRRTPAARLEHSKVLAWLLGGAAVAYMLLLLARTGVAKLDLNGVNLLFLAFGMLLHGSPKRYGAAVSAATGACAGIILQFPFYAGIMGLMALSGLMATLADGIAASASATSFPVLTFFSAGLVNLFVPSGGGQWAVQGPIVIEAAHQLGVPLGKAIMAFCYGDQWTNMLQPFWALPLLGIMGLKAGEVIGYTATLMLLIAPLFVAALMLF